MTPRYPLGTVAQLWRYPVKSLAPEALERADIALEGVVGDRDRALFVTSDGHVRSGRTYRGKEHHLMHTVASIESARQLAAQRDVTLSERNDGPFFDAEAISIVFDRWIGELENVVGTTLDPQRFRPNIYVRAAHDFDFDEAALVGETLDVGDATLHVVSEIKRCVTITYDVETGEAEPLVHRVLAAQRANVMGVYCRTRKPGAVTVGDDLVLRSHR